MGLKEEGLGAIEKMRQGVEYRHNITCRGFSVSVRPISIDEQTQVTSEVISAVSRIPDSIRNPQNEVNLLAKKILVLATTTEPGKDDSQLTELVLGSLTPDELQYLYKQYCDACDLVNPALESFSQEQINQAVEEVKKNPSTRTRLSRSLLCQMVVSLLPKDQG